MEITLSGRAAIITGGSKGIGLAIASRFAGSGADVAIIARGREALDQAAGHFAPISCEFRAPTCGCRRPKSLICTTQGLSWPAK